MQDNEWSIGLVSAILAAVVISAFIACFSIIGLVFAIC